MSARMFLKMFMIGFVVGGVAVLTYLETLELFK